MSILANMPHTATIKTRTRTRDNLGGSKDSFTTVSSGVKCWRQVASDAEIRRYQQRDTTVTDRVYFSSDPSVDEKHIIIIGSDTLSVRSRAVPDASAGLSVVWRVMCELEE